MLAEEKFEETPAAGVPTLITTASEAGSRAEKRIWGTPQLGQKGERSSTIAPQPWQGCSTSLDYLRERDPGKPKG